MILLNNKEVEAVILTSIFKDRKIVHQHHLLTLEFLL
jgi:hypothetical protein